MSALQDTDRDVGILYSSMNQNYNYVYNDSSFEIYSGLVYNGMMPLFVSERQLEPMKNVKILFVPYVTNAYSETLDAINNYLDNGGKVIIMGDESLKKDEKNQPHDSDKVGRIYERSTVVPIEVGERNVVSPNLYEVIDYISELLKEENMDIVRVVDADTGELSKNVEWQSAFYNGKLLVNVCNFGDYDDIKKLNVYVRGKKVNTMKELRFNQTLGDTLALDPGKPLLLQIDTDSSFIDTYRHWAEESITSLWQKGIVYGVTNTKFCPEKTLTVAQWTAMLMRAAGIAENNNSQDWEKETVDKAKSLGILDGTEENVDPKREITRDETAKMLYLTLTKVMGKSVNAITQTDFADIVSEEAKAVCNAGFMFGYPDNTFGGEKSLTRAEAAAVLAGIKI